MFKVVKLLYIFFVIILLSCDAAIPLSEGEQIIADRAEIILSMNDDNFQLTISTNENFINSSYLQFRVIFNFSKYSIESYTNGDGVKVWSNLDEDLSHDAGEFIFSGIGPGDTIVKINFSKPNNYEGTRIYLDDILIRDSSSSNMYYFCDDASFEDPVVCKRNGGVWGCGVDFYPRSICYIDQAEGSLEEDGKYKWASHYCDGKQDDGP